jgi:hypothetical protein
MNCIEFEAALEYQIESRMEIDPLTMEHVGQCPQCQIAWQIHQQLDAAIVAWRPVEASAGLVDKVLAELMAAMPDLQTVRTTGDRVTSSRQIETSRTSLAFGHRSTALVASAACLMMAVVFLTQLERRELPGIVRRSHSSGRKVEVAQAPLDVSLTLSEVLSDLRSEYHEMATETKSAAMELVNGIPRQIEIPRGPDADEILVRPISSDVSRIWRPIGSRVETALGFLWQSLPTEVPSG